MLKAGRKHENGLGFFLFYEMFGNHCLMSLCHWQSRFLEFVGLFLRRDFYPQYEAYACFAMHLLASQVWAVRDGTGEASVLFVG